MAKSHIFPRSLMHEIRGDDTAIFAADKLKGKWIEYQSGPWDRTILCQQCEASLSDCDDYAVSWIRDFPATAALMGNNLAFEAPNPKPRLLVKFVAATLWRAAVAPHLSDSKISLGPWEYSLRRFVFDNVGPEPRVFIARKVWAVDGVRYSEIAVPPYNAPLWGKRAYTFDLSGFQWGIRLDCRTGPNSPFIPDLLCNRCNPARVLNMGTKEITDDDGLVDIVVAAERGSGLKSCLDSREEY